MRSVADELSRQGRAEVQRLSAEERIELAFRLGEDDLEAFRLARGLDRAEAIRQLERRRQEGRRRSVCMLSLLE